MGKVCEVAAPITVVKNMKVNRSKPCHSSNYTNLSSRTVEYLVFHYTGNSKDTASANCNYFMNNSNLGASAHYFVDDTSIWQSVDVNDRAWHCGTSGTYYHSTCRNANSIGIEMCCTAGNYRISDTTKENAAQLGAALCKYLGITDVDKYVVRHWDVTHKNCPAQMAGNNNAEWTAFKTRIKKILNSKSTTVSTNTDANTKKSTTSSSADNFESYKIRVTADVLNIRAGAGTNYKKIGSINNKGIYTIVKESAGKGSTKGWGKLKSGIGWISLDYVKKLNNQ